MKVFAKTRKSHCWNEDRYIIGKNFFVVVDGATELIKTQEKNLACWFANFIKQNANKHDGDFYHRLKQIAKDAYQQLGIFSDDTSLLPSASMCWVEEVGDKFKASLLGDCEITFVFNDGKVTRFFDDSLNKLDNLALDQMRNVAKTQNIDVLQARKHVQPTLVKHRQMINKPNGYTAFVPSPNFEITPKTFEVDKADVKEIYLYSDGFAQSFDCFNIYDSHQDMFANSLDLATEIDKIKTRAFADEKCNEYPRFKKIDDITAIKIVL